MAENAKPTIEDRIAAALAPEPVVEPAAEPQVEVTQNEAAREDPERVDTGAAASAEAQDGAAAGEPETAGAPADEGEGDRQEPETIELGSFADLASHIGVEVDDLYGITVPIDVDGKKVEYSIGEWKDKVRAGVDSERLAEQRREWQEQKTAVEAQIAEQRTQAQQGIAQAAALADEAEKRLLADIEGVNWAELRESDPAEWAAKQTELKERQAQIRESKAKAQQAWQAQAETQQREHAEKMGEHVARERDALLQAIPEWRDETVFDSERKQMREYLSGQGFTDVEVDNATDHRLIIMARKAQAYDRQLAKAKVAQKKVTKVSKKVVRPGSPAGKAVMKEDALAKLRGNLRKTGKIDDAAAIISASRKR